MVRERKMLRGDHVQVTRFPATSLVEGIFMDEWELRKAICTMFLNGDQNFPLDANTRLLDDGICDSLGLVQLAAELERRCPGIRIADQEITRDTFGTIAAIVQFLGQKVRTN